MPDKSRHPEVRVSSTGTYSVAAADVLLSEAGQTAIRRTVDSMRKRARRDGAAPASGQQPDQASSPRTS